MGMYYRELVVWRKAMDLAKEVYRLAPLLPKSELYGLRSQLTRAAASIPANIAEGWARGTEKQRAHFLAIALDLWLRQKLSLRFARSWGGSRKKNWQMREL